MKISDFLTEGPAQDLIAIKQAKHVEAAFAKWIHENNEDTPLGEIPEINLEYIQGVSTFTVPAAVLGLRSPSFKKLNIGFGYDPKRPGTKGLMMSKHPQLLDSTYYVLGMVDYDPSHEVDVAYSISWSSMIHEIIHFFDYRRGLEAVAKQRSAKGADGKTYKGQTAEEYYNNPVEFNAHYQQGVAHIDAAMARMKDEYKTEVLKSFGNFARRFMPEMPKNFFLALNDEYTKKLNRRFYRLYHHYVSDANSQPH
jgi:pterin-4a-carbinolamine dehydratase